MNRRNILFSLTSFATLLATPHIGWAALPPVQVYRNPGCGCCEAWAELMTAAGFQVSIKDDPNLAARRVRLGIAENVAGCHTSVIEDLVFEGHIPPADIQRFLAERPAGAIGLAVPGMPVGSPGMGPEGSGAPYDVLLLRANAEPTIYAQHQKAKSQ
jgi:hypothetical protein